MNVGLQGYVVAGDRRQGSGGTLPVVNPATGRAIGEIADCSRGDVNAAVESARATFESTWSKVVPAERGRRLSVLAGLVMKHETQLAKLECTDVGKPIVQATADVRTCARYFEYYGGLADKIAGQTIPVRHGAFDATTREPYGVSAQIVPWNFPLAMASRGIAPALAAGNSVVAKPAEDASLSVLRLAELALEAGFPAGAFNVVTGVGAGAGAYLVSHPDVRHITFTGSVQTGTAVMKMAAETIKPVSLELGGKSPNIVFADADIELAANTVIRSILINAGQTCNSCPRLLVHASIKDRFIGELQARLRNLSIGDPMRDPAMGPLVSSRHRDAVLRHVALAEDEGAHISRFGTIDADATLANGFYVPFVIADGVTPMHRIFHEEVFGPVLTVTTFNDDEEAIALANDSEYGLNAGVFSTNIAKVFALLERIRVGMIYVNGYGAGGPVEVPFGGFGKSGIGREKGVEGLYNYTQTKSITVHY